MTITTIAHLAVILSVRDPILLSGFNSQVLRHDEYGNFRFGCRMLPTCFRFASPVLGDFLSLVMRFFDSVYSEGILPLHSTITSIQKDNFFLFLSSLTYPVIAVCTCFLLVKKLTNSFTVAVLFLNLFLFLLSGQTMIWLSKLVSSAGLIFQNASTTQRLIDGLATFPTMYLVFYDYSALIVLCVSIWFLSNPRSANLSLLKKFTIGLISTAFFENLGIVFFIAICWIDRDLHQPKSWRKNLPVVLGSGLLILAIQIWSTLGRSKVPLTSVLGTRSLFGVWKFYFSNNVSSFYAVSVSLALLLGLPLVFGILFGKVLRVLIKPMISLNPKSKGAIEGYSLGLAFSIVVGFFTSGLSDESGRQTLGLQFLILLLTTLRSANYNSKSSSN